MNEIQEIKLKVSVIIPAYQSSKTIERAIISVQRQDYKNLEIIIVDNGSTDNIQEIANSFASKDNRIKMIRLEENKRPAGGRNAGVKEARGDYIAFLDSDDEWLPQKIDYQVPLLQNQPDIGLVMTDSYLVNTTLEKKELYSDYYQSYIGRMIPVYLDDEEVTARLIGPVRNVLYEKCIVNLSSVIMRRELFFQCGGFDENLFGPEDMDLWVKLAKITNFGYVNKPLVNRYVSSQNVSNISETWLMNLLDYHKRCYENEEYKDLKPLIIKNLEKYYRYLVIHYGNNQQSQKAYKIARQSMKYGFFVKVILYAILTSFGKKFFNFSINIKSKINMIMENE